MNPMCCAPPVNQRSQPVSKALLEVQGLAHHPKCQTHSRGSTEQPWCSCGLSSGACSSWEQGGTVTMPRRRKPISAIDPQARHEPGSPPVRVLRRTSRHPRPRDPRC